MPGFKAGDKYRIYKCPHCTGDNTIEWLSPEEIERQKKESEELTDDEIKAKNDEQDRMQMFKEETES